VATLKQHGDVGVLKRHLTATALGKTVHPVLASKLPGRFVVEFTAPMETKLDEIAVGKQNGRNYRQAF
jgi:DNA topoisomerase IA